MSAPPRVAGAPRLLVLTDRHQARAAGRDLVGTVAASVAAGAPGILFREKDLPRPERRRLAAQVARPVAAAGAALLVASDPRLAAEVGAAGVHLAAHEETETGPEMLRGRSCHDLAEVAAAVAEQADYVTVSPIGPTPSKPGYGPVLTSSQLRRLTRAAGRIPVLALGGVTAEKVRALRTAGLHGVAVMGAVMGSDRPAATVRSLLDALEPDPASKETP